MIRFILIIILIKSANVLAEENISNLIMPVSYFVNHVNQLDQLNRHLRDNRKASIVGTSGIGKTQLVRKYAQKNQYHIKWFIDCNLDIAEEFVKLAKKINKSTKSKLAENAKTSRRDVMEYLATEKHWLLVFDNLKINQNHKIQDIIKWDHNGHVIFCSQDIEGMPYVIKLNNITPRDAKIMARNLLHDKKDAEFLSQTFGGYPILISQAAQLLNAIPGLEKKEYKIMVNNSQDKLEYNLKTAINELTPNALQLLKKISLINNQKFSREFLRIISDHTDDDIYQLSKFMLISGAGPFEMHDIIAQKIIRKDHSSILEDIITRITNNIPKGTIGAHLFREGETIRENLQIIQQNAQKYKVSINKMLALNLQLITKYVNSLDVYNADKLVKWFNNQSFSLWSMNNDERARYAEYLAIIGGYYRRLADYNNAVKYYSKSQEVFNDVIGYESSKYNGFICLGKSYLSLGKVESAKKYINAAEELFSKGCVQDADMGLLYFAKARTFFMEGNYQKSLDYNNKAIKKFLQKGIKDNDIYLTGPYMVRAEIYNIQYKYQEAIDQLNKLYKMQEPCKKPDHEIFARIYTQIAKSKLGLNDIEAANKNIDRAISIYLADKNSLDADNHPDLAATYIVKGDIEFTNNKYGDALNAYKKARMIYFY